MTGEDPPDTELPTQGLRGVLLGSVGARLVNLALGAVAGIVIARELAPLGRGQYAVVITTAGTAVALSHLSVEQAHLSMWRTIALRRTLVANAVVLAVGVGSIAAVVAFAVVHLLGQARVPVYSSTAMAAALAAVPVALLVLYTNSLIALSGRVDRLNRGLLLSAILQTSTLVTLAVTGNLTVTAVIVVWSISTALPLLATLPVLRPRARHLSRHVMRAELVRGARYHVGGALLFLLFRADIFLVNAIRSAEEVGLYALAVTLAELLYVLSDSIAQTIVERQAGADQSDAAGVTALAVRVSLVGAGAAVVALALIGPLALPVVYGEEFRGSVSPFVLILPGVLAFAASRPIAALLAARDLARIVAGLSAGAFAINVALGVVLIPLLGIDGAALSSTIAYTALAIGYLVAATRFTECRWPDFLPDLEEIRRLVRSAAPTA